MAKEVPDIDHVLDRLGELSAMPSKVAEVMRVTDDPVATMDDLNAVIERDPALTAKILKVSNSPYYGMRQFVGTLKLALVVLGVREVRNIILGVAVLDTFGSDASLRLLEQDYWKHSNTVGAMSRCLVTRLRVNALGEAFVAGLLHDIGKVVMARQMPEIYEGVMKRASEDPSAMSEIEREMAGFGHAEAGTALGVKWNFPVTLPDAILAHHPGVMPLARAKDSRLAAVVRISNRVVRRLLANQPLDMDAPECLEAWALLDDVANPLPVSERQAFFVDTLKEIQARPQA